MWGFCTPSWRPIFPNYERGINFNLLLGIKYKVNNIVKSY